MLEVEAKIAFLNTCFFLFTPPNLLQFILFCATKSVLVIVQFLCSWTFKKFCDDVKYTFQQNLICIRQLTQQWTVWVTVFDISSYFHRSVA